MALLCLVAGQAACCCASPQPHAAGFAPPPHPIAGSTLVDLPPVVFPEQERPYQPQPARPEPLTPPSASASTEPEEVDAAVAANKKLWWAEEVRTPQRGIGPTVALTLEDIAVEALSHSHQIQSLRVLPAIGETRITQAEAAFDATVFLENRWFDRDEPVGSFLTTGGVPRFLEETVTENIGYRRKTQTGASVEVSQQLILQESNSTFFIPNDQAQTRLSVSLRQPLLRDAGKKVNRSLIVLASVDTRVAWDEYLEGLQDHLLKVVRQYWQLYLQRSLVLQKQRNLDRAVRIQKELENRRQIDALRSQIARARSKVASRRADLIRAQAGVRNAEAQLRSLVNSPRLCGRGGPELLPADAPVDHPAFGDLCLAKQTALQHRPEIDNLLAQIKANAVRTDVAKNQLLPSLALVLDGYVNGLTGEYDVGRSFGDQFSEGAPSYTAGLAIEVPLGRRQARARLRQRQLELARLSRQLSTATAELGAEVEIANREVRIVHQEFIARLAALEATRAEVEYLTERWRMLPGYEQSTSFVLDDLLNAEDRLVEEEQQVVAAQVRQALADAELQRALGTLLSDQVETAAGYPVILPAEPVAPAAAPEEIPRGEQP
ncbi:MAG: TolC family protein [Planctomycetota bacterium]